MAYQLGGVHTLITGINGQGKTLYTVAEILRHIPGTSITDEAGVVHQRRLCVSGIKALRLEHEIIDAPAIDPERVDDPWRDKIREPGDLPQDVHHQVQNWWLWCKPGDVIVIDECQRVFRPMASGRRIPMYIEKLETARHYGVQFLYITQTPDLLHKNVRNLAGPHQHIERIFGGTRTVIYEWPRTSNPDRIRQAVRRIWKHDKSAFKLYQSSQLHTKFGQRLPLAVPAFFVALVLLGVSLWHLKGRLFPDPAAPVAVPGSQAATNPGASSSNIIPGLGGAAARPSADQAVTRVTAAVKNREPYAGFGVHLAGSFTDGQVVRNWFTLSIDGRAVATVRDVDVNRAGYAYRAVAPCSGVLIFGELERAVVCDAPFVPPATTADQKQPAEAAQPQT